MTNRHRAATCLLAAMLAGLALTPSAAATADGAALYTEHCANCHDQHTPRMPDRAALGERSAAQIVRALESGTMRVIGTFALNGPERVAVAEFLSGETYDPGWADDAAARCAPDAWPIDSGSQARSLNSDWDGWGNGADNTRYQPASAINRESVGQLRLAWAFAFPGETIAESQPTVYAGRLFVGSRSGRVYALDPAHGCVHWTFDAAAPVKGSVVVGAGADGRTPGAYFGDLAGNAYAVDAASGELRWRVRPEPHPSARIMGSVLLADNRLLVPMTSTESTLAAALDAECCIFRGSLVALDPATGRTVWQHFTVPPAARTGSNSRGVATWGPAGATIWSAPSYDAATGTVYVGTGENYSNPPTATSDSIVAIDINSGARRWVYQGLAGDAWNMSCGTAEPVNCPTDTGPDYDFGSSPILTRTADGRPLIIAAQKSGVVHALDPARDGALLWRRQIAEGGVLGGIEWGPASDGEQVYVAIADLRWNTPDLLDPNLAVDASAGGGLVALSLDDGSTRWSAPGVDCSGRERCSPAQTAAVTAVPGVVFAGSLSGELRAFNSADGSVLWTFDTAREFDTVNGARGRGGALDATGPVVVDDWLYVVSGYSKWGGLPGNVLLAFRVD